MSEIEERLQDIRDRGLYRRLRCVSGPQGPRVLLDGRPVLLLCSNNYLGLADHPRVREAAADAAMRWGVGAGASRLVSGNMTVHRRLEEWLAGKTPAPGAAPTAVEGDFAGLQVRLWDPSTQLRFARKRGPVPPRPDGAPNAFPEVVRVPAREGEAPSSTAAGTATATPAAGSAAPAEAA